MGRPRHPKPDTNQSDIIEELESLGFYVLNVSPLASCGFDLLVCGYSRHTYRPEWLAVEVKAEGGKLTERERKVQVSLVGMFGDEAPLIVAQAVEQVLEWFNART